MLKPTLVLDVDGLLADLHPVWYGRYNRDTGDNLSTDTVLDWNVHQYARFGKKVYEYLEDPSLYDDVLPLAGACDFVELIRRYWHIVFATNSTVGCRGRKKEWLRKWGMLLLSDGDEY